MKNSYLRIALFLVIISIVFTIQLQTSRAQLCNLFYDLLPPCPDSSADGSYSGSFHTGYGGMVDLSDPLHYDFSNCYPPPANVGDTTIHTFSSTITATVAVTAGPTFTMVAPGAVTVMMIKVAETGNERDFKTEMLELDIAGGNLPPGTLIQESPTKKSKGFTGIVQTMNGYCITSYFDIWTELSLDNGVSWIPGDTSGHMQLDDHYLSTPLLTNVSPELLVSPNPLINEVMISFQLPITGAATLEILDLQGRQVDVLFDHIAIAGQAINIAYSTTQLPYEVYLCRLSFEGRSQVIKLVK